jgi:Mn2+/Fe2+ NRAMP family transporter
MLALLTFLSYKSIAKILKWLTLALLAYIAAGVLSGPDWKEVIGATFVPRVTWKHEYLTTFVALFGTSISPYLFFWQSSQEVEEQKADGETTRREREGATRAEMRRVRNDTVAGMCVSQIICYFIIVATGTTIYASGHHDIQTAQQAAQGLKSIGSGFGTAIFAIGLIGTGLLGVPTLAGSAAYALGAAFGWKVGMDEPVTRAKAFYAVIAVAMVAGAALDFAGLSPVTLLFGAAVVNGLLAPPLLVLILLVANNKKIMRGHKNGRALNVLGWASVVIMAGSALWLAVAWLVSKL